MIARSIPADGFLSRIRCKSTVINTRCEDGFRCKYTVVIARSVDDFWGTITAILLRSVHRSWGKNYSLDCTMTLCSNSVQYTTIDTDFAYSPYCFYYYQPCPGDGGYCAVDNDNNKGKILMLQER